MPGWVLITVMTAGLVAGLWAIAGSQLGAMLREALVVRLRLSRRRRDERGAAVVDFVLVSMVLVPLVLGLIQVGLVLHVRNTLAAAATEGARYGATIDRVAGRRCRADARADRRRGRGPVRRGRRRLAARRSTACRRSR